MAYQPGQRVVLIHTDDPYTDLRPGAQGTVTAHDLERHTVAVSWDSGSELSMCLDAGDRIKLAEVDFDSNQDEHRSIDESIPSADLTPIYEELFAAGSLSGRRSADGWARRVFGNQTAVDVVATARRVLAGIERDDASTLADLPTPDVASPEDFVEHYTGSTSATAPSWTQLTPAQREAGLSAYVDGFALAVVSRAITHCLTELGERGMTV